MPKFFVKSEQLENNKISILGNDVNHIKNVLRMNVGDTFNVCVEDTSENYIVQISSFEKDKITCQIIERMNTMAESNVKVHIYQGLPKSDKMELIIQKSVELGAEKIIPVEMKRCVVKLDTKDKLKKVDRWQKISEVAAKQSGRDIIPEICQVKNIKEICEEFSGYNLVLLCYENEKKVFVKDVLKELKTKIKNIYIMSFSENIEIAVIIGPEGGIDVSEVEFMKQAGAKVVSLGNRILRTETVSLSLLSIIMYEFERNEISYE